MNIRTTLAFVLLVGINASVNDNAVSAPLVSATPQSTVIVPSNGGESITIRIENNHIDISAGGSHLVGDTMGDKRYYHRGVGGQAFVEVKSEDGGFKIRAPDSKLLWKVKIAFEKIKISDNEENKNAWSIKTHDDKQKVSDPSDKEIGEVKFDSLSGKSKVKNAVGDEQFTIHGAKRSAAYGIVLMSGIPPEYRDVIVAELLARDS